MNPSESSIRKIIETAVAAAGGAPDREWDSLIHISVLIAVNQALKGRVADAQKVQDARTTDGMIQVLLEAGLICRDE